jgi:hypothetical protein
MDVNEVIKEIRGVDLDSELTITATYPNYQTKYIATHKNSCICAKFCPEGILLLSYYLILAILFLLSYSYYLILAVLFLLSFHIHSLKLIVHLVNHIVLLPVYHITIANHYYC